MLKSRIDSPGGDYIWERAKDASKMQFKNLLNYFLLLIIASLASYMLESEYFNITWILCTVIGLAATLYLLIHKYPMAIIINSVDGVLLVEKKTLLSNKKYRESYKLNQIKSTCAKERISKNFEGGLTLRVYKGDKLIVKLHEVTTGWNENILTEIHAVIISLQNR